MLATLKMFAVTFFVVQRMYRLPWQETNNFFQGFDIENDIDRCASFCRRGLA
jgi:hypothetical protein